MARCRIARPESASVSPASCHSPVIGLSRAAHLYLRRNRLYFYMRFRTGQTACAIKGAGTFSGFGARKTCSAYVGLNIRNGDSECINARPRDRERNNGKAADRTFDSRALWLPAYSDSVRRRWRRKTSKRDALEYRKPPSSHSPTETGFRRV